MSKHGILIRELVVLRQKYLAKLSKLYGYNSKITQIELLNFLTQMLKERNIFLIILFRVLIDKALDEYYR